MVFISLKSATDQAIRDGPVIRESPGSPLELSEARVSRRFRGLGRQAWRQGEAGAGFRG